MRRSHADDGPQCKKPKTTSNKKGLTEESRVERNVREQKRSLHISQQINEIRNIITKGGMYVQKATKCGVLQDAIDYIQKLQESQQVANFEKHMLLQELGRLQRPPPPVAPASIDVVPEFVTVFSQSSSAPQPRTTHLSHENLQVFGDPLELDIGYAQEMQGDSNQRRQSDQMLPTQASNKDRYHNVFDSAPVGMVSTSAEMQVHLYSMSLLTCFL